ncbi:MAG: iron dependent repressor, metal binding and dimerization domain protein [Corynebacterium sp.]|nr:iron dependent repressor, metal binding and dimerization domain protein [Corynebacterium sp.]
MKDLVDTTEMYLRTIYELEEEDITPLRARIAERLEQSGPTVSQTVARMERDGLVVVANDRSLQMTPNGRALATAVMRKHRLAERLLTDVIGLDIQKVHEEACRWEHVMSDEVERRLVEVLPEHEYSPFGNPIPGLDVLGITQDKPAEVGVRAYDAASTAPRTVRIVQINEILQVDHEQFAALIDAGITVGSEVELHSHDGHIVLSKDGNEVELLDDLCHAVRIEEA